MTTDTSRVWLVTGSSTGFGREVVRAALDRGDRVVATARRPEALADLVALAPDRVLATALDVTDHARAQAVVREAIEHFGRLDVVVNNAGFGTVGAIEEVTMDELRDAFETMFFGAVAVTQAALPVLREQGSGAFVAMSSLGGQSAPPGFGTYCSAKFALEAFHESLAAEVAPHGLQVLIIEPGAFRTNFSGANLKHSADGGHYTDTAGQNRDYLAAQPDAEPGDPRKAAAVIVRAVGDATAPLHLALGNDAVDGLRSAQEARVADLASWETISRSTDFDKADQRAAA